MEEQKIRRYPVDSSERNGLRNFGSNQWQQFFEKYAKDLQCPDIARETNVQTLCWILGYALRLEVKYGSERTSDNPLTFLDNIDGKLLWIFLPKVKFLRLCTKYLTSPKTFHGLAN